MKKCYSASTSNPAGSATQSAVLQVVDTLQAARQGLTSRGEQPHAQGHKPRTPRVCQLGTVCCSVAVHPGRPNHQRGVTRELHAAGRFRMGSSRTQQQRPLQGAMHRARCTKPRRAAHSDARAAGRQGQRAGRLLWHSTQPVALAGMARKSEGQAPGGRSTVAVRQFISAQGRGRAGAHQSALRLATEGAPRAL